ncbi:hypothetical protein [Streptomyces tubercidicus]|uniref:hypothetical protein n=1 Tax=Streptomyces tubercidicus TaxID=47759 RepID=UPI0036B7C8B5
MSDDGVRSVVLAKIAIADDQEFRVRRRSLEGFPTWLDFSQYNLQGGGYRLSCPVPDNKQVLDKLIRSLQRIRDQEDESGDLGPEDDE